MVLNYIWIAFFVLAFIVATIRLVFFGDAEVFPDIINSTFASSKSAFEISLGLTGVLALWMGIMRIGEQGGVIALFSRVLSPLFSKLFPDIPKGHPVTGSIFMNMAANMLGLDNAATPLGLKAMEGLQELNPKKDTATNPMIMFLVINTSGLTLIPISIMVYRAQLGAAQPTDVFVPILIATFISTLAGIIAVALYQPNRPLLYHLCQCFPICDYHRFHLGGHPQESECVRCIHRRSERGIHHRRTYHSISGGDTGGYRRVPCFGVYGLPDARHRLVGRDVRIG